MMHIFAFTLGAISLASPSFANPNGRFVTYLEPASSLEKRMTGDNAAGPFDPGSSLRVGTDWRTSINVGGQTLRVQIDTGSSDLWLASTLLPQDYIKQNLGQNTLYDPSKSTSWKPISDEIFNISYADGSVGASGVVGTETVNIGGASVTGVSIGAATEAHGSSILYPVYDGLLGLGFQSLNSFISTEGKNRSSPTFMMMVQPELDEPVFTCNFQPGHPQSLAFGFVNQSLYTSPLTKLPIDNSTGYWVVDNVTFSSGNQKLGGSTPLSVIMDTGGVGDVVDPNTALDYWKLVQGATYDSEIKQFIFPCNTATLPDLTLNFNANTTATIKGAVLNGTSSAYKDGNCIGGLQTAQSQVESGGSPTFNSGYAFFASYFTVWNQSEPSLSFAPYSTTDDTAAQNTALVPLPTATANAALMGASMNYAGIGLGAVVAGLGML